MAYSETTWVDDGVPAIDDTALNKIEAGITDARTEYMYPVWAEENAAIVANGYEWAFGNGANTPSDGGMTMYVPSGWTCTVIAMSLRIGGGTATVQLVLNGASQGASCNVAIASGQSNTEDGFTPVAIANNDYINFRTQAASGTSGPCVITAWVRMLKD